MSVAKGADYPIERTKKSGIPFVSAVEVPTTQAAETVLLTVRPVSDDYVLYIDRIHIEHEDGSSTWEIEINSPYLNFFDGGAGSNGDDLTALINDPAKTLTAGRTKGNIYLDGLMASYYYKKASNPKVASTGTNGAWTVVVGATQTIIGTGFLVLTFVGIQVKKKKGTTDTSLGQV